MANSTIPYFRKNLATELAARAGLTGVQITRHMIGEQTDRDETIQFLDVTGIQEHRSSPWQREERYTLNVYLHVRKSGGGDTTSQEAEDRLFALIAEIEDELRDKDSAIYQAATGKVLTAQMAGFDEEGVIIEDKARVARANLNIDVHAHINWSA